MSKKIKFTGHGYRRKLVFVSGKYFIAGGRYLHCTGDQKSQKDDCLHSGVRNTLSVRNMEHIIFMVEEYLTNVTAYFQSYIPCINLIVYTLTHF